MNKIIADLIKVRQIFDLLWFGLFIIYLFILFHKVYAKPHKTVAMV